ncbi:hypothetical protein BC628DRAFT_1342390 [Trametes gibbosa]|nr:hypothetical protein BC628DRAFT_1342390 [Trametes gibbosa]
MGGQPAGEGLEAMDFICPLCHISEVRQNWKDTKSKGSKDANVDAQYKARHSIPPVKVALNVLIYEGPLKWTSHGIVPQVLYEAMKPYLVEEEEGNLIYKEVEFDLNTNEDVDVHPEQIMAALGPLASIPRVWMLVFVYTHTNEETRTLFFGTNLAVQTVCNWFDVLLPEDAHSLLMKHDTIMSMLCCGVLGKVVTAYEELKTHCLSLLITHCLVFEAGAFQATFATPFFLAYAHKFLLKNVHFDEHQLRNVVAQSMYLGRHSRVIMLFTLDNGRTLQVSKFIWLNCGTRPWGEPLPMQCKGCKARRTYNVKEHVEDNVYITLWGQSYAHINFIVVIGIMWLCSRTQSWRMRMSELQPSAQRAHGQPGLLSATPGWRARLLYILLVKAEPV